MLADLRILIKIQMVHCKLVSRVSKQLSCTAVLEETSPTETFNSAGVNVTKSC